MTLQPLRYKPACFITTSLDLTTAARRQNFWFYIVRIFLWHVSVEEDLEQRASAAWITSMDHSTWRSLRMASGINIYSQLVISTIRIADITNLNCWYQQFELVISAFILNCWYQQFELLINSNCWYQQFELLISLIRIVDINNSNCWYQQFELLISLIVNKC